MPKVYQIYYFTPWGNAYWFLRGVQIPTSLHFPPMPPVLASVFSVSGLQGTFVPKGNWISQISHQGWKITYALPLMYEKYSYEQGMPVTAVLGTQATIRLLVHMA